MASKRKATSKSASSNTKKPKNLKNQVAEEVVEEFMEVDESEFVDDIAIVNLSDEGEEEEKVVEGGDWDFKPRNRSKNSKKGKVDGGIENVGGGNVKGEENEEECELIGAPVPDSEARRRWGHHYVMKQKVGEEKSGKSNDEEEDDLVPARRHFTQAKVDGQIYNLYDDAYVMADGDEDNYICKIVEIFESEDGSLHFTAQWFYRAKDTVIKERGNLVDEKCIFFSDVKNDNPLNCLLKKLNIVKVPPKVGSDYKEKVRDTCDYYYEMMYLLPYTSFVSVPNVNSTTDGPTHGNGTNLSVSTVSDESTETPEAASSGDKSDLILMDIYSGCGAMSTGLCLGASRGGVKLTTKWAIDINQYACSSLRLNHPETQVRNEPAENFLSLMEEWYQLCASYSLVSGSSPDQHVGLATNEDSEVSGGEDNKDEEDEEDDDNDDEVYEVEEILEICYGDPKENNESGLHFKIKWRGYGPEYDTWEPRDCLSGCPEKLKEFVVQGFKSKLLPLPGDVDVICGGPPCQGISGYNRFRNAEAPLEDEKNKQLKVFMDIVSFLKPKYVLMENVVDIIKFADASLGKYAIGRLVAMGYQTRMGMMAAGSYGLPQFRMRVFLWGGLSTEKLPQYALPTHKVVNRGVVPQKYESNVVAYEEGHNAMLKKELTLEDALSDLPPVENNESRDEMPYNTEPKTDFQRFIRLKKDAMLGSSRANSERLNEVLYDHRPLELNTDDYQRVCLIPVKKGANFRDLEGVCVGPDNKVFFDPNIPRALLPSGKPLVPDYAMTFVRGTSTKPFGRMWWDEIVPTVTTRAEPHNHVNVHPTQNRVLTVRELARLQGFPDFYKLVGPIKQRYMQVGNAVAVPVARALGYCLALAYKGDVDDHQPLLRLPNNFLNDEEPISPAESS
ncbi:hypothetical protein Leryth_012031 [Lithospermum erythrorhizon]|nr:hypothetical protein Leryth_012031 [Lithospermum erythrorhizon]